MARGPSLIPQRVKNTGLDLVIAGLFLGGGILFLGFANKRFGILDKIVSGAGSLGFKVGEATGLGLKNIPQGLYSGVTGIDLSKAVPGFLKQPAEQSFLNEPAGTTSGIPASYKQDASGNITVKDASGNILPQAFGETGENQNFFAALITAIEKNPEATADIGGANTRTLVSGQTFKTFQDLFKGIQAAPAGGATPKKPLDVAKIIQQTGQRLSQSSTMAQNKKITNKYGTQKGPAFGGFGSAVAQESTMQALIAANAKRYPQWFKVV